MISYQELNSFSSVIFLFAYYWIYDIILNISIFVIILSNSFIISVLWDMLLLSSKTKQQYYFYIWLIFT
jgi:hypothetical protein